MHQPCRPCGHPKAVNTTVQRARSGQPTHIGWAPLNSRSRTAGRRGRCSRQSLRSSPPTPPGPAQQADRLRRRCTLRSTRTMQTGPQATGDEHVCPACTHVPNSALPLEHAALTRSIQYRQARQQRRRCPGMASLTRTPQHPRSSCTARRPAVGDEVVSCTSNECPDGHHQHNNHIQLYGEAATSRDMAWPRILRCSYTAAQPAGAPGAGR